MKKYYLNGTEVNLGDIICRKKSINTPFGEGNITETFKLTPNVLEVMIGDRIIKVKDIKEETKECNKEKIKKEENTKTTDEKKPLSFYVNKIASRLGWKYDKVVNYINSIYEIMPAAAFSILLREIAIELDKKYLSHISDSPEIYGISLTDGKIMQLNKAHIKNYRNFAAFRTIEDAKTACSIMKHIIKDMFKDGK